MVARVTLAEVDTMRVSLDDAIELYRASVLPAMREQDGYAGVYVLATQEGKALVISFWDSEEASESGIASGFYAEQVGKFVTFYRAVPGRESYDVVVAEMPGVRTGG
jgi:heme-degrading monooxygenase HmoA